MITFKQQGNGKKSWYIDGQLMYESPTNKLHNQMLFDLLKQYDYIDLGEVSCWVNDPKYKAEAKAIINWWIVTCKLVNEYVLSNPNEETSEEFLLTLPIFTL